MKLVKPYYKIETEIDGEKILKHIEKAARTCYKTEGKIGDFEKTKKFISSIIKREHESTIEHYSISVRMIVSRSFSHELVRHRLASYSQECLSGDTEVRKGITIKNLYERQNETNFNKTYNKTLFLMSSDDNGKIITNKFNKVFYKGIQDVFEVTTNLGYKIKTTMNHKFKTKDNKFTKLNELKINDLVYVNDQSSLLKIEDSALEKLYLEEKLEAIEISANFQIPYGWYIGKKEILDKIISIEYIGKEETYDLEMNDPYHNYIANGFVVHNSTRYCNYCDEKFGNDLTYIIPPNLDLEEGIYKLITGMDPRKDYSWYERDGFKINTDLATFCWLNSLTHSEETYKSLILEGWKPQDVRSILPNALKTEIVMTCNIREYRHLFKLRTSLDAHPEIREIMIPMLKEFQQKIPVLFDDIKF